METEQTFLEEELACDYALEMSEKHLPEDCLLNETTHELIQDVNKIRVVNKDEVAKKLLDLIAAFRVEHTEMLDDLRVVGYWLWFDSKEELNETQIAFLKALGFRWNIMRGLWQHNCGVPKRKSNGDPRLAYGSFKPDELMANAFPDSTTLRK